MSFLVSLSLEGNQDCEKWWSPKQYTRAAHTRALGQTELVTKELALVFLSRWWDGLASLFFACLKLTDTYSTPHLCQDSSKRWIWEVPGGNDWQWEEIQSHKLCLWGNKGLKILSTTLLYQRSFQSNLKIKDKPKVAAASKKLKCVFTPVFQITQSLSSLHEKLFVRRSRLHSQELADCNSAWC